MWMTRADIYARYRVENDRQRIIQAYKIADTLDLDGKYSRRIAEGVKKLGEK